MIQWKMISCYWWLCLSSMFQGCITKFRRNDFVSQPLNSSCIRAYKDNCRDFLPVANCLQINEYNFFSMEFPWQINCINFFLSWLPKSLCFKINNQQTNGLYQTFIVKNDQDCYFFSLHLWWLLNTWLILKLNSGK